MVVVPLVLFLFLVENLRAEGLAAGFFNPYVTTGIRISPETITPTLRKWYLPQTLYHLYGWKNWEYTNYARDKYKRYVDILLEGDRFYDLYGNYITRGWRIYEWNQEHAIEFGSGVYKAPEFGSWFSRVVISSASKGQYHMAVTIGEMLRTTLTPMTFSKPLFDGVQWDMLSDKYSLTLITSRISNPSTVAWSRDQPASSTTIFSNLIGLRGTVQVGDFLTLGGTYVNAGHWNSSLDVANNSLKGTLGGGLNAGNVQRLLVRLADDSPEDGVGGSLLFLERILIDGVEHPEIRPLVEGGIRRQGRLEASGGNVITLAYDIERDFVPGIEDEINDFKEIRNIEVELVLANDYAVEVTSNMQTNNTGELIFLPVTRAADNIQDGSNQRVIRFSYGLPSANEVAGLTMEIDNLLGFNMRAEYDINRRFRRFPNQNIRRKQALGQDDAEAFYLAASQSSYPWFAYGEVFSMDSNYNTNMFIPNQRGVVDYENTSAHLYEFVDDNDDQDRYPDWARRYTGGPASDYDVRQADFAVFPGFDENNDLVSDFNQNDNHQPDYVEPFIRYNVDPLDFLFGTDMNNNTVIDRFENDREPDYPYKRDHRGYNVNGGVEIMPGTRVMAGHLREWLLSNDRRSKSTYGMLTLRHELPKHGLRLHLFDFLRSVRDDIPDDVILWTQPPFSSGGMEDFSDPLIATNTLINTLYLETNWTKFSPLNLVGKFKHEIYHQKGDQAKSKRDERLLTFVTKADYRIPISERVILWPKWKQLYLRQTPTNRTELKANELSEILFFTWQFNFTQKFWVESGVEYEVFRNIIDRPDPLPPGYIDDFKQVVLAAQFTNQSEYLGYQLLANFGTRWERKSFKEDTGTNIVMFLKVFAGLQSY